MSRVICALGIATAIIFGRLGGPEVADADALARLGSLPCNAVEIDFQTCAGCSGWFDYYAGGPNPFLKCLVYANQNCAGPGCLQAYQDTNCDNDCTR